MEEYKGGIVPPIRMPLTISPIDPVVSIETVIAFFKDFVPNFKCGVCSSDKFSVLQFFDVNIPSVLMTFTSNPSDTNFGAAYTTFATSCSNCGHIQHFLNGPIRDWAQQRRDQNGG